MSGASGCPLAAANTQSARSLEIELEETGPIRFSGSAPETDLVVTLAGEPLARIQTSEFGRVWSWDHVVRRAVEGSSEPLRKRLTAPEMLELARR